MADELSNVQASQGVNPLWPVTGAAVGGVGTYYTVDRVTRPKYHKDIIDKMEPDKFESTVKDAEEADKALLEKVRQIRTANADAEAEFNAQVKAIQEASAKPAELPANHQALTDLKNAQDALAAKKNALVDAQVKAQGNNISAEAEAEIQRLNSANNKIIQPRKNALKEINAKLVEYATEKNSLADEFANAATTSARKAEIKTRLAQIQGEIENLANNEALGFGKNVDAKKEFIARMNTAVENIQAKGTYKFPKEIQDLADSEKEINKIKKSVNRDFDAVRKRIKEGKNQVYTEIEDAITSEGTLEQKKEALKKAITKMPQEQQIVLNEIIEKNGNGLLTKTQFRSAKPKLNELYEARLGEEQVIRIAEIVNNKKVKTMKEELETLTSQSKKLNGICDRFLAEYKKGTSNGEAILKVLDEFKEINPNYKREITKAINGNSNRIQGAENILAELKQRHATMIQTKTTEIQELESKVTKLKNVLAEAKKLEEQLIERGGEGAKLKLVTEDGQRVYRLVDKDGNVVTKELNENMAKLRTWVGLPKDAEVAANENRIAELRGSAAGVSREEIAKGLKEADFAEELKAVKAAETRVNEAKAALPKPEALSEEQALEKFLKDKGVASKEEYINNQVKEKTKGLMDEVKSLFERKHGFEGNFKTKAAVATAVGAAVASALFYAIAPKKEQA